jgi:hypothetical protein
MNDAQLTDALDRIYKAIQEQAKKVDQILIQPKALFSQKELNAALAAAQSEFEIARKSKEDNYYHMRYENLTDVVDASRPYLAKNGLSVTFLIDHKDDGGALLTCSLLHSSGQSLESKMRLLPSKNDPKSLASEVSFMKRILYAGITGVVADDEDDDAEVAMATFRDTDERGLSPAKPETREERIPITKDQYEELEYELAEYADIGQVILDAYKIRDLASMPKSKYSSAMSRIRAIKALRNKR